MKFAEPPTDAGLAPEMWVEAHRPKQVDAGPIWAPVLGSDGLASCISVINGALRHEPRYTTRLHIQLACRDGRVWIMQGDRALEDVSEQLYQVTIEVSTDCVHRSVLLRRHAKAVLAAELTGLPVQRLRLRHMSVGVVIKDLTTEAFVRRLTRFGYEVSETNGCTTFFFFFSQSESHRQRPTARLVRVLWRDV